MVKVRRESESYIRLDWASEVWKRDVNRELVTY